MRSVLGRVRARATTAVMGWDPEVRRQAPVLALIVAVFFLHYAVWCLISPFYIEDAGISFAYARNIATGLGAVPFAGAERVEGYSNASWTFLLAALYVLRIDPFFAAKALGGIFGAATLLVAWAIGREARGDSEDEPSPVPRWAPLLGPALLAASTQFTLWSASGLENSLFNLALGLGIWRLAVEIRTGARFPWSALAFFVLAMTRPDGIGYAGVGLFARVLGTARQRQWRQGLAWIVVFAVPLVAYNVARHEYFGWWFPNTYYAKDKSQTVKLTGWTTGGWKQFKEWAFAYGVVFAAPAAMLALLPLRPGRPERARRALLAFLLLGFAAITAWDGRLSSKLTGGLRLLPGGEPITIIPKAAASWYSSHVVREWNAGAVYFLLGGAVLLGLLTLGRRGWAARGLLWGSFAVGVLFWVWSNGDWMKCFRWGSLVALPVFTLVGLGVGVIAENLPGATGPWRDLRIVDWTLRTLPSSRRGWTLLGLVIGLILTAGYFGSFPASGKPIEWPHFDLLGNPRPKGPPAHVEMLLTGPVGALLGLLVGQLLAWMPTDMRAWRGPRVAPSFAVAAVLALAAPNTWKSAQFVAGPETTVNDVHRRANYMTSVQEKLDLDDVTLLDVDMGAHMYFTRWHIADMAGLIDVAMARHKYQKSFIDDYVFNEVRPTFAHVHGSWARTTKIPQNPKWKEQYLEITGYPSGKRGYHVGNHIRKDLVARTDFRGPADTQVDFEGGVTMAGWELPAPEVAPGGKLFLHTWWIATPRKVGFRVLVFLKDKAGHLHAAELAPAFDWYKPEKWKANEYVEGSWYMPIPPNLPEGDYDLGVVVLDAGGQVLSTLAPSADGVRYLPGEWVSAGAVHLVPAKDAMAAAEAELSRALALADKGDCEAARGGFKDAWRHVARNLAWREAQQPAVNRAVTACFVRRAAELPSAIGKSGAIAAALWVDPTDPDAIAAGQEVAEALFQAGLEARENSDPQAAYASFLAALRADPTRSLARVYLEEARDLRLGISGKEPEKATPPPKKAGKSTLPLKKTEEGAAEEEPVDPVEAGEAEGEPVEAGGD